MNCPNCDTPESRTLETRIRPDGTVRRRRECDGCGHRFSSLERVYVKIPSAMKGQPLDRFKDTQHKSRLTDEQVLAIYHSSKNVSTVELARRHGISKEAVRQIQRGITHKKVLAAHQSVTLCSGCVNWSAAGSYCLMGFPDPELEGMAFAKDCSLYEPRTQDTRRD